MIRAAALYAAVAIGFGAGDAVPGPNRFPVPGPRFPGGAMAVQRPDFSGDWTVAEEPQRGGRRGGGGQRGAAAGDMGSGWGRTITVAQTATMLTVQYEYFVRGDLQPPMKFVYALDGSERSTNVMLGRGIQRQTSGASWQADTLVITTVHHVNEPDIGGDVQVETRRRLWLAAADSLVVEATRSGVNGGAANTSRTVYRK